MIDITLGMSAFETSSVRTVHINIINYCGIILALNNTMQTIQREMKKKPHTHT